MGDDVVGRALHEHAPGVDDIGAVDEAERLAHIMVRDQHADAAALEVAHQLLDVAHRDRIDAGEGLVEQHVIGSPGERASDLATSPLAARKRDRRRLAQARDVEFLEQRIELAPASRLVGLDHLEHGAHIVLDIEAAEDRRFLRQIADTEPGAAVHRQLRHIVPVEIDVSGVRREETGDHVEHGRLARAVRAEKPDRLAAHQFDADMLHDLARAEALLEPLDRKKAIPRHEAELRGGSSQCADRRRPAPPRRHPPHPPRGRPQWRRHGAG